MIIKNYILENDIKMVFKYKIFLLYGENEGFKNDVKKNIKKIHSDHDILNYFQNEIVKNENILLQEIFNKSLFERKKIIYINQADDKIIDILDHIVEKEDDVKVIIFSDILDKKSKLRNFFEKSKNCAVAACYPDNEITIRKIIEKKLYGFKGLTPQLINLIIRNTGLNRNQINNEIEKIVTLFEDKKIDIDKLDSLLNIKNNDNFNKLRDEALVGNKTNTNRLLADTVFETENNIYYLNSINQRIQKLYEIENLKKSDGNIDLLISQIKPPVFWKDKPIITEQSKKWNKNKILSVLEKTYNAEIRIKSNSSIRKDLVIKNLLIEICYIANSA